MSSVLGPLWLQYWVFYVCTGSAMSVLGIQGLFGSTMGTVLGLSGLLYGVYSTRCTMSTVPGVLSLLHWV